MTLWGVTDAGYKFLERTGLDKRIEKNWNIIQDILPHSAILENWHIDEILEKKDLPTERRETIKRWLKEKGEFDRNPQDFFMISGKVTDVVLTKEERTNYKQFSVKSLGQLDGLLAAFCLTKYWDNPLGGRGYYVWRSEGLKTQIYGNIHGDLQVHQVQTKPKDETQLFGELPQSHINAYYDYWPVFVGTALKYADTVEIEIPEAQNWREFMQEYGWDGRITKPSSSWGVGYDRFVNDFCEDIIAQLPDKTNVREVKKMFFGKMRPESGRDIFYLPVIDEEKNLVFYANYGNAESIELAPHGEPVKCSPIVYIPKSDTSHLFKGAV